MDTTVLSKSRPVTSDLRIGVIGCGEIACTHLRFIRGDRNCKVVGVCDSDSQRARDFAHRFDVKNSYSNVQQFLSDQKPNIVHVLTPPQSHATIAIQAMQAGCNVLVEKPMALTSDEANDMVAVATGCDVKLCVNHNQLFEPIMIEALAQIRSGAIGRVVSVQSHYGIQFAPDPARPWVEALPGGVFQNLAPHPLYLILEFLGDPIDVHTSIIGTGCLNGSTPDELHILVKGVHGIGYVAISLNRSNSINYLRICGTVATLHVDFTSKTMRTERTRTLPKHLARALLNIDIATQLYSSTMANAIKLVCGRIKPYQGHENLIKAFYLSIRENRPPPVSLLAARRVVEVYDQVCARLIPGTYH